MIDLASEMTAALAPVLEELRQVRAELAEVRAALPSTWLSLREAAERLGCAPRTVVAMSERGEVVARRCGRRIVVDTASLRPPSAAEVGRLAREAQRS